MPYSPFYYTKDVKDVIKTHKERALTHCDVTQNKSRDIKYSKDAPEWRGCIDGLNIEGLCLNKTCKAYGKQIICPIGMGKIIDLVQDIHQVKCPICSKNVEPITCGFTNCQYTWLGMKKDEKGDWVRVRSNIWWSIEGEYRYFDPTENGSCEWRQLKILTKPINPRNKSKEEMICAVCDKAAPKAEALNCNHSFHDSCLQEMNRKCVICPF